MNAPGAMHNKETFRDYLLFVGFHEAEIDTITERLIEQKGYKEDFLLFRDYLETKLPDPHFYDMQ